MNIAKANNILKEWEVKKMSGWAVINCNTFKDQYMCRTRAATGDDAIAILDDQLRLYVLDSVQNIDEDKDES